MEKRLTKEEFLKDLWHPASEMPDKNRTCLVRVVYHPNHGMFQDEERNISNHIINILTKHFLTCSPLKTSKA